MGREYQDTTIRCEDGELYDRYAAIVRQAQYEHGHAGYSGTFAEKPELEIQDGAPDFGNRKAAEEHCCENNDKWGPSFAYYLGAGSWYIGGWCSS